MMDFTNPNDFWTHPDYDQYKGMSDDERMKAGCLQLASYIVMILFGLLLCALLGSCKSVEYVPVIEHRIDTVIQNTVRHDSIMVKDSIYVQQNGDTVRIEKWHMKYVEREVHDTVYISKTDSVPAPYPVEVIKEVPAELSWWQQLKMRAGGASILLCLMGFLIWIWRKTR